MVYIAERLLQLKESHPNITLNERIILKFPLYTRLSLSRRPCGEAYYKLHGEAPVATFRCSYLRQFS